MGKVLILACVVFMGVMVGCGEDDEGVRGVVNSGDRLRAEMGRSVDVDVKELERRERGEVVESEEMSEELVRLRNENAMLKGELLMVKGELAKLKKAGEGG